MKPMRGEGRLATLAGALGVAAALLACTPPPPSPSPPQPERSAPQDTGLFKDRPPYASAPVDISAAAAHKSKKVSVSLPSVPDCLRCHKPGGSAAAFLFAGTVFEDSAASRGAADVEVRVVDANGVGTSARSDADGNFWVRGSGPLAKPAHAGARTARSARVMHGPVATGDCNSCHSTDTPMVIGANP